MLRFFHVYAGGGIVAGSAGSVAAGSEHKSVGE